MLYVYHLYVMICYRVAWSQLFKLRNDFMSGDQLSVFENI